MKKKSGLLSNKKFQDYLKGLPTIRHTQVLTVEDGVVVAELEYEQTGNQPPKTIKKLKGRE